MSKLNVEFPDEQRNGGPSVQFKKVGDAVVCQFLDRSTGIKTTIGDDQSVTNAYVVNTNIRGVDKGENASIWEGTHVKQLMTAADLKKGEGFVLRFLELKGKFKRFGFMKLEFEDLKAEANEAGVELPEVPYGRL